MIIDAHVHCFADKIAPKAIGVLEEKSGLKTIHDGTINGLKSYMGERGVDKSVILPVATNPSQVSVINEWAWENADNELVFFGAAHPDDADFFDTVLKLKAGGFKGVKLHPDYQLFYADERRMMPLYEALRDAGLILALHCGLDNVYPVPIHCTPLMVRNILENIPGVTIIATHMGAHAMWRDAEELLAGQRVYMDTCYSQYALGGHGMKRMIKKHGAENILFGTDSPWKHADDEIKRIEALDITSHEKDLIFSINASRLLGL